MAKNKFNQTGGRAMTSTEQDKELRRAIVDYRIKCDYYLSDRDAGVVSQEEYETAISSELDSVIELINTQKRLYAESVIGEDDAIDNEYGSYSSQEVTNSDRNELREEQRARIK